MQRENIEVERTTAGPASPVSSHFGWWRRLFGVVPHQGSRSIELDFVRGIAILLVVKFHSETVPSANRVFRFFDYAGARIGDWGVDLFFVLSGFLVGGLLMKEYKRTQALDAKRFIFRRGLKIWPAYYVFLLLEVVTHAHPLRTFLWQNALHVQNYAGSSILHSWSLAVEEHFYLILVLGMGWMVGRRWTPQRMLRVFLAVMAIVFVVRSISFVWFAGPRTWEETHNRLDSLLCGVTLALLFHFFPERFAALSRHKYLLGAIVVLGLAYRWNLEGSLLYGTFGYSFAYVGAAALLLLVYAHSATIRETLLYRAVALIGVYSYAIYLYHLSVRKYGLWLGLHSPRPLQWPVAMVAQFTMAIAVGAIMTRVVEWPVLRLRDRIIPQRVNDIGSPRSESKPGIEAPPVFAK